MGEKAGSGRSATWNLHYKREILRKWASDAITPALRGRVSGVTQNENYDLEFLRFGSKCMKGWC
jgi:hypothetical protein